MKPVDLRLYGMEELASHAAHLNEISAPDPNARPFFENMSGGIIWSDETLSNTSAVVICALRQLFYYRTHLILTNSEPDNAVWDHCVKLFPNWVGFRLDRRKPSPEVLAEYRRGDISLKWCLRKIEREMMDL